MRVECTGCGGDCSNAYGTWNGDPYHIGCIPTPPRKRSREPIKPNADGSYSCVMTPADWEPPAGYAYEHTDGSIIHKPYRVVEMGGGPGEYFDSPFVKRWWRE